MHLDARARAPGLLVPECRQQHVVLHLLVAFRMARDACVLDPCAFDQTRVDDFERARVFQRLWQISRHQQNLLHAGLREPVKRRTQRRLARDPAGDDVG